MELKACQSCGGNTYEIIRDPYIFKGQNYGKRYPVEVSTQPHGYKFRCECGMQTCWWHYKQEAIDQWNTRTPSPSACKASPSGCKSESVEKVIAAAIGMITDKNEITGNAGRMYDLISAVAAYQKESE